MLACPPTSRTSGLPPIRYASAGASRNGRATRSCRRSSSRRLASRVPLGTTGRGSSNSWLASTSGTCCSHFDFSRLARNQEDLGWIANRLRLHRRRAFEASTGLDLRNIGARVMGVVNEEYLAKLAEDTRRGLRGRAESGLLAAGLPYGYRTEAAGEDDRSGRRLVVDAERAEHVRRIFNLYLKGYG